MKKNIESNHETYLVCFNGISLEKDIEHQIVSEQSNLRNTYRLSNGKVAAVKHLKYYVESKHEKTRHLSSQCDTCSFILRRAMSLKCHIKNRHKGTSHKCHQRDFTFRGRTLNKHNKRQQQQKERRTTPSRIGPSLG